MAEEIVKEGEEIKTESPSTLKEEVDYKALAEAEKARADAAEALIVKNKNLSKREETGITEDRVLELIKASIEVKDDSKESTALVEAQKRVKELESVNAEIVRASKAKEVVQKDASETHRDGELGSEPKLPDNSPLKSYKYIGNGIYSKKLATGKTMFKNLRATGNERGTWIE